MALDVSTLNDIAMTDLDKFVVFDVSENHDPKVITGEGLRDFLNLGLNDIISNLNDSFVSLTGDEIISGEKTFIDLAEFSSIVTFSAGLISNGLSDFSSSSEVLLPSNTKYDGTLLSTLLDQSNLVDLDGDQDITGIKTFENGFIVELGTGSIEFPTETNVTFGGVALSDLVDKTGYLALTGSQDITGFKTFKNGVKVEKGTGSIEFPDKADVTFNGVSLETLMQDAGNFIDVSDFVVTADLNDYIQTDDLDDYALLTDISDFVNNTTFNNALTNYVTIASNENITGVKTFKNGLTIEKGTGSVDFPAIADVNFDGNALSSIFGNYTLTSDSRNIADCLVVTGSTLTLYKSTHHNKIIYFDISQDCTVSLDPAETDWSNFQCKFVVHDASNTHQVIFNFIVNDGSVSNMIGHFSNINLHYCSNLTKWTAFSGNF